LIKMAEYDYVFKYLVLGGAAVGKHTLIDRFS
jgi:GTPase SAR1 family protein